jgi:hypothetical protein
VLGVRARLGWVHPDRDEVGYIADAGKAASSVVEVDVARKTLSSLSVRFD